MEPPKNVLYPQVPQVTGLFSDMHYIEEAGDVLGTEVWIVYGDDRYYACVQIAEGGPEDPLVAPVEVTGTSGVKFTIRQKGVDQDGKPVPDYITEFKGTVSKAGLMLCSPEHKLLKGETPTGTRVEEDKSDNIF